VFHVKSGSGRTQVEGDDGETSTVTWSLHDTFAVPAWKRITHKADEIEDAYLFCLSDMPLLENLNMYRAE
jgi:gentisate 1,2-dioxygenase